MSFKTTSAPAVFHVLIVVTYYLGIKAFQMINGFMDFGYTNIYSWNFFNITVYLHIISAFAAATICECRKLPDEQEKFKILGCVNPWHSLALDNGCVAAI